MNTSEKSPSSDVPAADVKPQEGFWLPQIVHLHLTALETGWLMTLLHDNHAQDFGVHVPGENGEPVESTMRVALEDKLQKAWNSHD